MQKRKAMRKRRDGGVHEAGSEVWCASDNVPATVKLRARYSGVNAISQPGAGRVNGRNGPTRSRAFFPLPSKTTELPSMATTHAASNDPQSAAPIAPSLLIKCEKSRGCPKLPVMPGSWPGFFSILRSPALSSYRVFAPLAFSLPYCCCAVSCWSVPQ